MAPTRAVVVAILAAASLGGWWLGRNGPGAASEAAVVVAVDDGDTIEVRIGARTDTVRLLGIDTPVRGSDPLVGYFCRSFGPKIIGLSLSPIPHEAPSIESTPDDRSQRLNVRAIPPAYRRSGALSHRRSLLARSVA